MSAMKALIRDSGKDYGTLTIANGNTSVAFSVAPSTVSRLVNISKAFEFYRFTKLEFEFPPITRFETSEPASTFSSLVAVGWIPEQTNAASTTAIAFADVASLTQSCMFSASVVNANSVTSVLNSNLLIPGTTGPTHLRLNRKTLLSTPTNWFRANGNAEDGFNAQGQLLAAVTDAAGANTVVIPFLLRYDVELAGRANSAAV
jgi:hypothetical protein